jgi:hypothetical protein
MILIAVIAGMALRNTPDEKSEVRLQMVMDYGQARPAHFSLSPDGRKLVFARGASDRQSLFLRELEDPASRPLEGTDRASYPFGLRTIEASVFFATAKSSASTTPVGQSKRSQQPRMDAAVPGTRTASLYSLRATPVPFIKSPLGEANR